MALVSLHLLQVAVGASWVMNPLNQRTYSVQWGKDGLGRDVVLSVAAVAPQAPYPADPSSGLPVATPLVKVGSHRHQLLQPSKPLVSSEVCVTQCVLSTSCRLAPRHMTMVWHLHHPRLQPCHLWPALQAPPMTAAPCRPAAAPAQAVGTQATGADEHKSTLEPPT
jgi:hypothetical protein